MPKQPNNKRVETVEFSPRLTTRQKELMLTVLLRDESAFLAVRDRLKAKHFDRDDRRFALVWNALEDHYKEFSELPGGDELMAEVERRLGIVEDELSSDEIEELEEFLSRVYEVDQSAIKPRYGIAKAKQFIGDALASDLSRISSEWSEERPVLFGRMLDERLTELRDVETLDADVEEAFPVGWTPRRLELKTTNVPFWDSFMDGGQAGGEVLGLLGPFGSCKTTLMVQTAVEACLASNSVWRANGSVGNPERVYLASYEESKEEIRMRVLGYAAQILRNRLQNMHSWDDLERRELLPYERTRYAAAIRNGLPVSFERTRARTAMRIVNRCLTIYDMTGADNGRGAGLADELSALVRNDQRKYDMPGVRSVFVDYAGAAVERFLDQHDLDRKEMRGYLKSFPLHCKQKIAVPYNATVWIAHQLNGTANSKGSSQVQHHTDAAETKSFAENLVYCFTVGVKDQATNLCVLAKTKARRSGGSPTRIIRVEGEMWRVADQSHLYTIDPTTNRIAAIRDLNRVQDGSDSAASLPGARSHNVSQFSQAEVAGAIPGEGDEAPRRRLARRPR